jgi:hypothetical protein
LSGDAQPDAKVVAGDVQADRDADVHVVVLDPAFAAGDLTNALLTDVGRLGDGAPTPSPMVQEVENGLDVAFGQRVAHGNAVDVVGVPPSWVDGLAHWHGSRPRAGRWSTCGDSIDELRHGRARTGRWTSRTP